MKRGKTIDLIILAVAVLLTGALLAGCGNAKKEAGPSPTPVTEAATVGVDVCLNCHTVQSSAWLDSRHANDNSSPTYSQATSACISCHDPLGDGQRVANLAPAVGCESCHGGGGQHYGLGPIAMTRLAADTNGSGQYNTCTICHELATPFHTGSTDRVITDTHYDDPATAALEGYNLTRMSEKACSNCHNPHSADITINQQWRNSGHGNLAADPWSHYDWKTTARAACQRCHTTTGVTNFANNQAAYDANYDTTPDTANDYSHLTGSQLEVLYCNGCHVNYSGGMRNPGPITANYNVFISGVKYVDELYAYPDVSKSNVCMGCHTGRESGESIKQLNVDGQPGVADFSNLSFINSHYLTAGGTVFTATGYEFTGPSYANPSSYQHDKIGSSAAPNTGTSGPCAGCHMSTAEKHLFLPVTRDVNGTITAVTSTVCTQCHPGGEALAMSPAMLENQKLLIHDALEALLRQLDARGYYFRNAHPYFYQPRTTTGTVSVTNGSTTVTGTGVNWSTVVAGGTTPDYFKVNRDGTYYKITAVGASTITLETAYTGATLAGVGYSIIRSGSGGGVKNWLTSGDTLNDGSVTGKNNMGAAFNYNVLEHDPGAFAHNRYYSKRLIYDAIDWLDGNTLNDSVSATLNALDATDHPYKATAISYLLVGGGRP